MDKRILSIYDRTNDGYTRLTSIRCSLMQLVFVRAIFYKKTMPKKMNGFYHKVVYNEDYNNLGPLYYND